MNVLKIALCIVIHTCLLDGDQLPPRKEMLLKQNSKMKPSASLPTEDSSGSASYVALLAMHETLIICAFSGDSYLSGILP